MMAQHCYHLYRKEGLRCIVYRIFRQSNVLHLLPLSQPTFNTAWTFHFAINVYIVFYTTPDRYNNFAYHQPIQYITIYVCTYIYICNMKTKECKMNIYEYVCVLLYMCIFLHSFVDKCENKKYE